MRVSPNVLLRTTGSVHRETSALTRVMTRSLSAAGTETGWRAKNCNSPHASPSAASAAWQCGQEA